MSPPFLSPQQSRLLSAAEKKRQKTFRLVSELLLKHDFPELLCRELLNGRFLFSEENEKAAQLLSQTLPDFFGENRSDENQEPIPLEEIVFVYQFFSQDIPSSIKQLMLQILNNREDIILKMIQEQEEALQQLQSKNKTDIESISKTLSRNYIWAFVLFLVIAAGIAILFSGFYSLNSTNILIGVLLIIPALFITENPTGFVQFRRDQKQQHEVSSLKRQIYEQEQHIASLLVEQSTLHQQQRLLEAELRPPTHS